ncbi:hypothetical protein CBM2637_A190010 [Cupriavidus taiwanensis]|nr:hypothetical protein CBM2637_A190010 [Cupriavidus taiwanensis]
MISALICWYSGLNVGDGTDCRPGAGPEAEPVGAACGAAAGAGAGGESGCVPAPGVAAPVSCAPGAAAPVRDVGREDIARFHHKRARNVQPYVNCLMSYIRHMN